MSLLEQMRLQGLRDDFQIFIPAIEFAKHLGNSMSVNVLERILVSLLPAAGLWAAEDLEDHYAQRLKRKR